MEEKVLLYVDDEEKNLSSFKAVFRKDYKIFVAKSASEGLEILKTTNVQIVVSDQRMPNVTGVEFLEKIADNSPEIIRIIITGFSDYEAIIDSINKAKVYKYIPKPWKKEDFKELLDKAFELYHLREKNNQLTQSLEKVNKELDQFIYSAAHDLRAPISSIKGLILLSKVEEDIEQLKLLNEKKELSIRRLEFFISEIYQYAKNLRANIDLDEVDFTEMLQELIDGFSDHLNYELIKLDVVIEQNAKFVSDKDRIMAAIHGVLSNAYNYVDKEKNNNEVKVEVSVDVLGAVIKVTDNGIGVPEEIRTRIFEMFFRGTNQSTGAGLGLFIAKESLEKINGKIVLCEPNRASTVFEIYVPAIV